jgi:exosortase
MASKAGFAHSSLFDTQFVRSLREAWRLVVDGCRRQPVAAGLVGVFVALLGFFFGGIETFGPRHAYSALEWLWRSWNPRSGYEHGFIAPILILFLIARSLPEAAGAPAKPSRWGLAMVVFGAACYVAAFRTYQPRVALGGLPFILLGGVVWLRGWATARHFLFPACILYFMIPMPGLIQATNGLQLFATKSAYHLGTLLGVPATLSGNDIYAIPMEKWQFNIAEGCSGLRSLIALTLVSAVYAHLTQKTLWKKVVLFFCSIPLAILGNCLRLTSILLVAEYLNAGFAAGAYHEFSGFTFFLLVGLAGLAAVDWLLNRGQGARVVTRRVVASLPAEAPPTGS